jgi:transcriptional regulator GlxA family with amidase domain
MTPAKAIEALRLEAAKLLLEQSRLPIEAIAPPGWSSAFRHRPGPTPH